MKTQVQSKPALQRRALQSATPAPRYMPYGDVARVIGTVAVVIGHVCDMVVFTSAAHSGDWWVCNLADSATRWAVPIYVMLSGSLLLDPARGETPGQFYKKRLARLGVPIFFWTVFFVLFAAYYLPSSWNPPGQIWRNLLLGKPYAHLHFVYRIAGLYAFTPMLRVFLRHASEKMVALTVVLLLGLSSANSLFSAWTESELTVFARFAPFLGYYLAGYLLRERRISRRALAGCWVLACACALLIAGGSGLLIDTFGFKDYPSISLELYDFLSPVRVAFAIAAWLILVNSFDDQWLESPWAKFISRWLAPATLGIYLVHPVFREILFLGDYHYYQAHSINATWPNVWLGIPLTSLLVYLPSVAFVLLVMRIPYLRRIVM